MRLEEEAEFTSKPLINAIKYHKARGEARAKDRPFGRVRSGQSFCRNPLRRSVTVATARANISGVPQIVTSSRALVTAVKSNSRERTGEKFPGRTRAILENSEP